MIYATIESDGCGVFELADDGWRMRDGDAPALGRILDRNAAPSLFGPADGDPVACAAEAAAGLLGGRVTFVREPEPAPAGAVY